MRHLLLTAMSTTALTLTGTAMAQDNAAPVSGGIGDIIVTAQKRAERLQDVPIAVSAVTGDALQSANFTNITDIKFLAPSVQFSDSNTTRGQGFQVRGIGTSTFSDGIEQSVGVVVDGVALGRPGMSVGDLVDIERVEVLRGPQGMLFGKNASAGLINVTTRNPTDRLEARARLSYGTGDETKVEGILNVPLADGLNVRLVGFLNRRDGYVRNVATGEDLNSRKEYGFRMKLLWEPDDRLSVLLAGDWSKRDSSCCTFVLRQTVPGSFHATQSAANGIVPGTRNNETALNGETFLNQKHYGASGEVNYDLGGDYSATSLTAYREWHEFDNFDTDLSTFDVFDINGAEDHQKQFTQEVRLTSPKGGLVDFVVGAYYFRQIIRARFPQAGTLGFAPAGMVFSRDTRVTIDTENYAFFGQANVNLTDALTLIAGARYTKDDLTLDYDRQAFPGQLMWPGLTPLTFSNEKNGADNLSWRLGAQYDVTPDVMAYFTASRGYKGPGFTGFSDYRRTFPTQVAPEIPTSFEIGLKSTLLDRKLVLNLAAFTTDFKDFQAQVFDLTITPGAFRVANAGKLRTRGIEMDFTARPMSGFTLSGSAAYIDAFYKDFQNVACYPGQPQTPTECAPVTPGSTTFVTDASGNRLPNAPKFSFALAAAYETPVTDSLEGFANANYSYRSKVTFSAQGDPGLVHRGYGLLGGQIGLRASNDRWSAAVFVRNLLDTNFVPSIGSAPGGAVGEYSQFTTSEASRTVGVVAGFKFGG